MKPGREKSSAMSSLTPSLSSPPLALSPPPPSNLLLGYPYHAHEDVLTLDESRRPQEGEVHGWRTMPECDEFVGARRSKHSVVAYNDAIYVFGGDNGRAMLNDLLIFDTKEKSWTRAITMPGNIPAPRYHHSAVVYGGSMFVFGGYTGDLHSNSNLTNRNDLWEYKFGIGQWTEWKPDPDKTSKKKDPPRHNTGLITPPTVAAAAAAAAQAAMAAGPGHPHANHNVVGIPVPRSAHGAAVYDGKLVIFAGYDGTARLNDMWQISLKGDGPRVWEEVHYSGDSPPTCCNFPLAVARDSMFVFSGQSGAHITNSLFMFQFQSKTWTRICTEHLLQDAPLPPNRRYGHTMVTFDRHLYVFGGAADNILSNDLHAFDLESQNWSLVQHDGESQVPAGRLFHAAAVVNDAMYIFGGTVENTIRSGEMFRFRLAAFPKCTLQDDFGRLLESEQFHDIRFLIGPNDVEIFAHIALVVARSPWLAQRVRQARDERQKKPSCGTDPMLTLRLLDSDPKAFRLVLDFIYRDRADPKALLPDKSELVLTMMKVNTLAVKLKMPLLERLCVTYVKKAVEVKNVLDVLENANELHLTAIKEFCLHFIIKESNCNQVVMSREFESLDKSLMVEIIRRKQCHKGRLQLESVSDESLGTNLQQDLKRFLTSSLGAEFADLRLSVGGEIVHSHKAVLAARSSYFEGYFRSFDPPEDHDVQIVIGDMVPSRQSFQSLLRFIYYGEVKMPPEHALHLLTAPRFYIFSNSRLQEYCKHNLARNVTVESVIPILVAADKGGLEDMKQHALRLIARHLKKLANTEHMKRLSKELLLDINAACAEELG